MKFYIKIFFLLVFSFLSLYSQSSNSPCIEEGHLVVGPAENISRAVVHELVRSGIRPTVFAADKKKARKNLHFIEDVEIVQGRAETDLNRLKRAVMGKKYIYFCMNYAYNDWKKHMLAATKNVIAAASQTGATIIFPSVFYVLGGDYASPYTERSLINPCCSIGKVFKEAEELLFHAARKKACNAIIIRHPFPYGPYFLDGLISRVFEGAVKSGRFAWVHTVDTPIQVCYLPNLIKLMISLGRLEERGGVLYHYAGTTFSSVKEWFLMIADIAKIPYKVSLDSKTTIFLMARFHSDAAAGKDVFYAFESPVFLDDSQLFSAWPDLCQGLTPVHEAIHETLSWFSSQP